MHLQRVQVPDFRVLKDVDITFEKNFNPRVFPLGSQNGGGKSTLLQLIFVLLHCSTNPERHFALKNLLSGFTLHKGEDKRALATVDIWNGEKTIQLEFFVCNELFIDDQLKRINTQVSNEINRLNYENVTLDFSNQLDSDKVLYLRTLGIKYINTYSYTDTNNIKVTLVLLCNINNLFIEESEDFLDCLSKKVFLAAPSTQIFLFFSRGIRKLLFDDRYSYSKKLVDIEQSKLTGIFTYDFSTFDLLIEAFKNSGAIDFQEALETGEYGNNYKKLLEDLDLLLHNKHVNLKSDFSELVFTTQNFKHIIELEPTDLSHGELKRLSIYIWLKHRKIKDSIVLMDEVDLALHPDWQYQLVSELVEWSPTNQYVLATHSYELCNALTPSHVKILEPKLTERRSD
jgi:predicted ATP-dependent endonuclease of OLD family